MEAAALSHDGKRLAWLSKSGHEIWIGGLNGEGAERVFAGNPEERIPMIFWSPHDAHLWFDRFRNCRVGVAPKDIFINPDNCSADDLVLYDPAKRTVTTKMKDVRLNSGLFTDTGEFLFLREDIARKSDAFNLWSISTEPNTGRVIGQPKQLSHLKRLVMAQLTASRDGRTLAAVRTDNHSETWVAEWEGGQQPKLANPRRLALEQTDSFPHAWTADSKAMIFESDRNVHLDLFRQKLTRKEAETLVSTDEQSYMPQVTPDGKWILYMSIDVSKPIFSRGPRHLMRVNVNGGRPVEVALGVPFDEFRCSLPGRGTQCVLRVTGSGEQSYYQLDPIAGKGRELGRTVKVTTGLGQWALSADGTAVAIPDAGQAGSFTELKLNVLPSRRSESVRRIEAFGPINGMNPEASGNGWLVWSAARGSQINMVILPSFLEDPSRMEGLYYVDANMRPHLLYKSYVNTYGVFSPDGKHIAYLGFDLISNVWMFRR